MSEWIVALWQAGQRELARQHLERLAEQTPQDAHALVVVGQTWMKVGEVELAIAKFQQALSQAPDQVEPRLNLAMAQQLSHQPAAAIEHYSWILTHHPDSVDARNNLAWLYATYPEAKFRDGAKAEELARRLCEMSHYTIPTFLDTFAAACAENGHFDEAVRATQLAVSSARGRGEREQEGVRQERLRLYQSSQPYRAP
jgi:tetratricopeptide (TPR) repeat protein